MLMYVCAALCEMVHAEVCYVCSVIYHDPLSSFADGNTVISIVCVFGGFAIICCILGTVTYFTMCHKANRRRSPPTVVATHVPPTSAVSNERVTPVQRLHHVTPTNTNGPPSYVASTNLVSSEPPPYTADHINCPAATSLEYTPTFQLFPPEFIPIEDDLPPEYLPPPGSELEMLPLHGAPPTNPDAPSDPPTSTAGLSMSEHHPPAGSDYEAPPVQGAPHMDVNAPPSCVPSTHLQSSSSAPCTSNTNNCSLPTSVEDTPTPQPLLPESPHSMPNDEDVQLEYLPTHGSSA